jgi:hypothetical protein
MINARVEGVATRGWRLPKMPGRPKKDAYDARQSQHQTIFRPTADFTPLPPDKESENGDDIVEEEEKE